MSALTYWLWLSGVSGLGAANIARLLDDFGSPEAVYFADEAEFDRYEKIQPGARAALRDKSTERVELALERCDLEGVGVLTMQDALYPERLKQIYDPPAVLYTKGRLAALDELPLLTVVGSRTYTPYGADVARRMCYQLAEAGMTIVSGMAKGIDAYALHGALKAEGMTVAVLGGGPDVIYPAENRELYRQICETGLILSEYPPGTEPKAEHFPVRNRVMAALSLGTLVIEANLRSGALITARLAADQGRDVFCVPGSILTPESAGCHELIKNGAALVTSHADILREYMPLFPHKITLVEGKAPARAFAASPPPPPSRRAGPRRHGEPEEKPAAKKPPAPPDHLTDAQRVIYLSVGGGPRAVDDIVADTGLTAADILRALTMLEIEGLVETAPGKRFKLRIES
ncbi:MAG: DNA-processing protein DprA [Oscillospiraceae bacterium]|nr:DNA-processing protein DprA [Oscillospiraceae bacterium]